MGTQGELFEDAEREQQDLGGKSKLHLIILDEVRSLGLLVCWFILVCLCWFVGLFVRLCRTTFIREREVKTAA